MSNLAFLMRATHRHERISKWKHRLKHSYQQCYRWLKRPFVQPFRGLISKSLDVDVATADFPESLNLIRDHWRLVWRRSPADTDCMRAELDRQNLVSSDLCWAPLDPAELASRAHKFAGKAAGPDGWSGSEISPMPLAAFQLFSTFCEVCETTGLFPSVWQVVRQTHLPKGQKGAALLCSWHDRA